MDNLNSHSYECSNQLPLGAILLNYSVSEVICSGKTDAKLILAHRFVNAMRRLPMLRVELWTASISR